MASRIDDLSANGTTSATIRIGDPGPRPAFPGPWALFADFRDEYRARRRGSFPRGENRPSIRTTWRFRHDVLNLLLESYQRHGPIFGLRIVFGYNLAMIGPEANHFMLVSGRENFGWRHGRMGDLLTLIGDGLLTTDGDYHDGSRAILMPAFHRERIATAAAVMGSEAAAAVDALPAGASTDVYEWARTLAMRIAMGALFGFDPDSGRAGAIAARFESGLGFHAREFPMQMLFGPGTPLAKLKRDRAALEEMVGEEIAAAAPARRGRRRRPLAPCSPRPTGRAARSATGRSSTTSSPCSSPATTRRRRRSASSSTSSPGTPIGPIAWPRSSTTSAAIATPGPRSSSAACPS